VKSLQVPCEKRAPSLSGGHEGPTGQGRRAVRPPAEFGPPVFNEAAGDWPEAEALEIQVFSRTAAVDSSSSTEDERIFHSTFWGPLASIFSGLVDEVGPCEWELNALTDADAPRAQKKPGQQKFFASHRFAPRVGKNQLWDGLGPNGVGGDASMRDTDRSNSGQARPGKPSERASSTAPWRAST